MRYLGGVPIDASALNLSPCVDFEDLAPFHEKAPYDVHADQPLAETVPFPASGGSLSFPLASLERSYQGLFVVQHLRGSMKADHDARPSRFAGDLDVQSMDGHLDDSIQIGLGDT